MTGIVTPDRNALVKLLRECRMGLSILKDPSILEYDPAPQARELIGRLDRILAKEAE